MNNNTFFVDTIYQAKAWKRKFILFLVLFWCMCHSVNILFAWQHFMDYKYIRQQSHFRDNDTPSEELVFTRVLISLLHCLRLATSLVYDGRWKFKKTLFMLVIVWLVMKSRLQPFLRALTWSFLYTFKFWEIIPQPIWNNSLVTISKNNMKLISLNISQSVFLYVTEISNKN